MVDSSILANVTCYAAAELDNARRGRGDGTFPNLAQIIAYLRQEFPEGVTSFDRSSPLLPIQVFLLHHVLEEVDPAGDHSRVVDVVGAARGWADRLDALEEFDEQALRFLLALTRWAAIAHEL